MVAEMLCLTHFRLAREHARMTTSQPPPPFTDHHSSRLQFDGTINVPTLLTLVAMIAGLIATGLGVYNNLSDRIEMTAGDVTLLKNQVMDVKASQKQSRADVRGDLHDINSKIDQLLWDRGIHTKGGQQ
jgi:uncharacterized protein HemX